MAGVVDGDDDDDEGRGDAEAKGNGLKGVMLEGIRGIWPAM